MDLLLVSIDSLRLDHTARAPDDLVDTPRFDAATEAFAFTDRCFSVSSATRPVHTSLATGLYPFEHGVLGQHDRHVRRGAPRLFRQFAEGGFRVGLFSEAPTMFTGLDLGAAVQPLEPSPGVGVERLRSWTAAAEGADRCLFVHYWSAHTPYGATDGLALGETARLLREGRVEVVRERYRRAVESVFEDKVAPLIEGLDLARSAVVLFGDHGESWTAEEPYHGKTLRNSVLRVPLYLHVPFTGNPALATEPQVASLVDLYPTLSQLFRLPGPPYRGFGNDLLDPGRRSRFRLAEIRPGRDDDAIVDAKTPDPARPPLRWCVLDGWHKLMGEDHGGQILVDTWSEEPVAQREADRSAGQYREAREAMRAQSPWVSAPMEETGEVGQDDELLRTRLRALGYLE